jgi:hypothetical protein
MNRSIDMRLGSKVYDRRGTIFGQQFANQIHIIDIAFNKYVVRIVDDACKVIPIAGVGEFVQIDNRTKSKGKPVEDEIGTDEARSAGNEHSLLTGSSCHAQ